MRRRVCRKVDTTKPSLVKMAYMEAWTLSSFFNSFLAYGEFYHLLITFANSLDPDQAHQNVGVGPDLGPNC